MTRRHLNLLVDTNVWLDHFLGRKESGKALGMLRKASESEDVVATAPSIIKDAFYLTCSILKHRAADYGESSEAAAKAINEIGWACISTMQELSIVIPQGFGEHLEAVALRDDNKDYEDNLLLATAQSAKIDYIITSDLGLLKNKIVPAITPEEYLNVR